VSRQRVPRRVPDDDVALVGTGPAELAQVGRTVAKRPWVMAVAAGYAPALFPAEAGPVMVYRAEQVVRVRRYRWDEEGRLAEVVPQPAVPVVRVQPRRKSRAERRRAAAGYGGPGARRWPC
jgi:hypothetical protein